MRGVSRRELEYFLRNYLETEKFPHDYAPNGLQVEGKEHINRIAFSVSASHEAIFSAAQYGADALITHHGLFWKHQGARPMVGPFFERLKILIKDDINLLSYHLPLDAHLDCGNAFALANQLKMVSIETFGESKKMPLGIKGTFSTPIPARELKFSLERILERPVIHADPTEGPHKHHYSDKIVVATLGIITGGASGDWYQAKELGLDAYLTGELSEYDWHDGREAGIHVFAGGHHATEKFGIQLLMEKIAKTFPVETSFFDSKNPA